MNNPWTKKNPFMSIWLSSANKVMGSARAQAAAATKKEVTTIQAEATKQVVDFWTGKAAVPKPRKKPRR